ncbi:hypothetical protein DSM21852_19950 [Methylocystis bryophila]|nr:hypothetical protein DSM21852_19950 [Methylocystis bryophila]
MRDRRHGFDALGRRSVSSSLPVGNAQQGPFCPQRVDKLVELMQIGPTAGKEEQWAPMPWSYWNCRGRRRAFKRSAR